MGQSDNDVYENDLDTHIPLETLGVNELKLSGTSFILRDFGKKYIYKVVKLHSATEALFYSIAYRIYIPYLDDLQVNNINSDTFNNLSYLVENKIIPYFYGLTSISYNDYSWYELGQTSNKNSKIYKAIKLENLLHGFSNPGIIDIKLGSHNLNDDISIYGEIDDSMKLKCIESWRELKNKYRNSTYKNEPVQYKFKLNASDIGLPESYHNLDTNTLLSILKSWRQKQVALQTTEQELGFRISSIYFTQQNKNYLITSNEAKNLNKNQTMDILNNIFNKNDGTEEIKLNLVNFLNCLKNWISLQSSISIVASSVLIIFDQSNLNHYNIKWIDFTHVNTNSMNSLNATSSNMIKGINNLISIVGNS